ncbi:UNVERIFIED_CONTAM: hypothetical protein Sangu_1869300 [Sesamum angustifolium]|uniref:Uncharacterized protein n=1 Tax=Sesamum angustifolium TaxID=2727405 RepID=A0AAW2LTQ9_9LAMI
MAPTMMVHDWAKKKVSSRESRPISHSTQLYPVTVYPENGSCMSSAAPGSWWNPLTALVKHGITVCFRR